MHIFVIADTHFHHARFVEYEGRPIGFDQIIIDNWNAVVGPDDLVIHLGDFVFGREREVVALVQRLHGRIVLCLGNHDREKPRW